MNDLTFADRLKAVIGDEPPTPWATARGISGATIHEWLTKGAAPYPKTMAKLVAGTGIPEEWWMHGELPPPQPVGLPGLKHRTGLFEFLKEDRKPDQKEDLGLGLHVEQPVADYVAIPLYNGVCAAAGAGAIVEQEQPDDMLMFKEAWVRIELGARPQDLYLIRVAGDSMEPTLRSGDVILVNRRTTSPDREGVYILRMNGMLVVKRIQALPGGRVRVISDNTAFSSFDVTRSELEGDDIAVIGRVVWIGRRM